VFMFRVIFVCVLIMVDIDIGVVGVVVVGMVMVMCFDAFTQQGLTHIQDRLHTVGLLGQHQPCLVLGEQGRAHGPVRPIAASSRHNDRRYSYPSK
ncbi:MAG: hypothetical protein IH831_09750, partial [Planctomycetes bacterium]|nr:hypothetical protein [Planctomycetota bacterium]